MLIKLIYDKFSKHILCWTPYLARILSWDGSNVTRTSLNELRREIYGFNKD
jgi:hypothetical protein